MPENKKDIIDLSIIEKNFNGYYIAAMTDKYIVGKWPDERFKENVVNPKLLELRIFNENTEYKWFRGNIGENLNYRKLADDCDNYEKPIIEYQLLDIDFSKKTEYEMPGEVTMSKGGSFFLPLLDQNISKSDQPCIVIKYYVPKYDENDATTVHAYVKDWRLAGFVKKETGNGRI